MTETITLGGSFSVWRLEDMTKLGDILPNPNGWVGQYAKSACRTGMVSEESRLFKTVEQAVNWVRRCPFLPNLSLLAAPVRYEPVLVKVPEADRPMPLFGPLLYKCKPQENYCVYGILRADVLLAHARISPRGADPIAMILDKDHSPIGVVLRTLQWPPGSVRWNQATKTMEASADPTVCYSFSSNILNTEQLQTFPSAGHALTNFIDQWCQNAHNVMNWTVDPDWADPEHHTGHRVLHWKNKLLGMHQAIDDFAQLRTHWLNSLPGKDPLDKRPQDRV